MVEHPQMHRLGMMDVLGRSVVAECDDLHPLQAHDTKRLRPAPVVTNAHADDRIERPPYLEALVANIEIPFFEMLERRIGKMLGMSGKVDLAVAPDDPPIGLEEDRGVVMAGFAFLLRQLGIAEIKADTELLRQIEQRAGFGPRHRTLEESIALALVGHPVTRKERRQREFGIDDK